MRLRPAPRGPNEYAAHAVWNQATRGVICLVVSIWLSGCTLVGTQPREPKRGEEAASGSWVMVATSVAGTPTVSPAQDSDGDGLSDERERALGSNPNNRDTDGDGFDDGFEDMFSEFGFDILAPSLDSDQDGLEDSYER